MKGLFYKEARSLWHFGKTYLLMLVIFWGLPCTSPRTATGARCGCCIPYSSPGRCRRR